jgi:hypothetical protein
MGANADLFESQPESGSVKKLIEQHRGGISNLVLFDCGRTLWTFHHPILPSYSATPKNNSISTLGRNMFERSL